ncbi:MAG TPA: hypothetical protein VKU41_33035 [Polyangiaceae bacterium]|nr:hypothetical protein [Polyangiaceae bacterium]
MKCWRAPLRWTMAAALASTWAVPRQARADDPHAEAESLIRHGVELRRLGQDGEALDVFRRAYAIDPTPRAGAQAALAHQALGDWVDAERGLAQALGAAADPWIALYREVLEQALAVVRAHLGWLVVDTNAAQAEIRVDGDVETVPDANPIRVPARTLDLEIRAQGREPARRTVDVQPGARVSIFVAMDLEPLHAGTAVASATAAPPPVLVGPRDDTRRRSAGAIAFVAAGVFVVGGVVAWRVREDNVAVYDDDSRCRVGALTREQQCGGHAEAANVALGLEVGSFAIAAASAAWGAWEWWGGAGHGSAAAALPCAPWAGLGVACRGRF